MSFLNIDWDTVSAILTFLLSGNGIAILITFLFAFSLPILIHLVLYRGASAEGHNDFLLLGPSGSGKTALCALVNTSTSLQSRHCRLTSLYDSLNANPALYQNNCPRHTLPKLRRSPSRPSPHRSL